MRKKIQIITALLAGLALPLHTKVSNVTLGILLLVLLFGIIKDAAYKKMTLQWSNMF